MKTRPPAVAGLFYPADPATLHREIAQFLANAPVATRDVCPKALIVPHAGYIYSGPIAASAYASLRPWAKVIRRVVLIGPAHRYPLTGAAIPTVESFMTPLGPVPIDQTLAALALASPLVQHNDQAHEKEHSLEVELPFLQEVLSDFTCLPIVLGRTEPHALAELLDRLWGGPETIIVVSSDLSHYHEASAAEAIDRGSVAQILAATSWLTHDQACGATGINGLMAASRQHPLLGALLDLRHSGDTAGDRQRVVGYAALTYREL